MPNAEKLRETVQVIRNNQHRWSQSTFATGLVNVAATDYNDCGTTFCLAGWACVLDGLRPEVFNFADEANGRFHDPNDPTSFGLDPEETAAEILDLNEHEVHALFYFMTHDVNELAERVEEVIDGKWSTYVDEDLDD